MRTVRIHSIESMEPRVVVSKTTTATSDSPPAPDSRTLSMKSDRGRAMRQAMSSQRFEERRKTVQSSVKLRHRGITKYLGQTKSKDNLLDSGLSAIFGAQTTDTGRHWVDSNTAKSLFCSVIVLNAIFIGVDASLDQSDLVQGQERWSVTVTVLFIFEIAFLFLFLVEVILRIQAEGCAFFRDAWNLFDSVILLVTVADISVSIAENFLTLSNADDFVHMAKIFRIGRVLRLLRLFRFVQELNLILSGMAGSLLKLFWCLSLLFMTVYMAAIFALRYIGQAAHLKGDELIEETFGTLGRCMFTMFTFVTLEGFPDVTMYLMRPEILGAPIAVGVVAFIIFTNLAVLNLVAAVVLESIMVAAENDQHKKQARLERERVQAVQRLGKIFSNIHGIDQHAGLELKDFKRAVADHPELKAELSRLDVLSQDVDELFHLMDGDGDGVLSVHEFIEGLLRMQSGNASAKHVMSLQYDLQQMWNTLGQGQDALAEGQLFLRNDLRSGQRQVARRIEAKLERLLRAQHSTWPGSGTEEAETPTAAPVLHRQNHQSLVGWQWRKGQQPEPATPGSEAAWPTAHASNDKAVEQLEQKLSEVVKENLREATEQLERRVLALLERGQKPASETKSMSDVVLALEALQEKVQEGLVSSLNAATALASPSYAIEQTSQPTMELARLEVPGRHPLPHYSRQEMRPAPLDPEPPSTTASHVSQWRSGGLAHGRQSIMDADASLAQSCDVSPTSNAAAEAKALLRGAAVAENTAKETSDRGVLAAIPSAQNSQRRLSSTTMLSEGAVPAAGAVQQCGDWNRNSARVEADHTQLRAAAPARILSPPTHSESLLFSRPEQYSGLEGLRWSATPHPATAWQTTMWQMEQANSLNGSHAAYRRDLWPRLLNMKKWAVDRGLANVPFDKLVLHLDSLGIQLSIPEQDALRHLMYGPPVDVLGLQLPL
mmetsp:Transcript_3641/g.9218  ORF Transcript_3641/g.9218 Transcript_3641/m.9218 type:complete len:945 (-) Transcript_3641:38-2872(-)